MSTKTARVAIVSLFFLFLLFPLGAKAENPSQALVCDHPDYPALELLFNATDGPDWKDNRGWLEDCEPCRWKGIRCDPAGRVSAVVLRDNDLRGEIPNFTEGFEFLYVLSLPLNELRGEIPASLADLPALMDLYLSDNKLTGSIPFELINRGLLTSLNLDRNLLSGSLPDNIDRLTNARRIRLAGNAFSGNIPPGFGNLPTLQYVDLRDNALSGCIPEDLLEICDAAKYLLAGNAGLPLSGDLRSFCAVENIVQVGTPCDDLNAATPEDFINDNCGCGALGDLVVPALGNLPDLSANRQADSDRLPGSGVPLEMSFFPNPISHHADLTVNLPASEPATLRLLSITGRTLLTLPATGEITRIRLPELEPGMYLLEARSADRKTVKRLMLR